jgi:cysteinyl-tRNA synthetase
MIRDNLGETIDIHAGGADLIFPHHENEIAQSEAVTGKPLSRYWLHTAMVKVGGEKMSKSLGNFITIRDLLDASGGSRSDHQPVDPMVVRLLVLQAHYRKPIDFSDDALESATNSWKTLKEGLLFGYQWGSSLGWVIEDVCSLDVLDADAVIQFQSAMDDDFNSPNALAVLFELAKELRRERNILVHQGKTDTQPQILERQWHTLVCLSQVLGLEPLRGVFIQASAAEVSSTETVASLSDADIEAMIQQRADARKAKNFAEGDRIRNELQAKGITLIDKPGGVTLWHRN